MVGPVLPWFPDRSASGGRGFLQKVDLETKSFAATIAGMNASSRLLIVLLILASLLVDVVTVVACQNASDPYWLIMLTWTLQISQTTLMALWLALGRTLAPLRMLVVLAVVAGWSWAAATLDHAPELAEWTVLLACLVALTSGPLLIARAYGLRVISCPCPVMPLNEENVHSANSRNGNGICRNGTSKTQGDKTLGSDPVSLPMFQAGTSGDLPSSPGLLPRREREETAERRPVQFSILYLFGWTTAVAIVLSTMHYLAPQEGLGILSKIFEAFAVPCVGRAAIAIGLAWALLAPRFRGVRLAMDVAMALVVGGLLGLISDNLASGFHFLLLTTEFVLLTASLTVIRQAGYRWGWKA